MPDFNDTTVAQSFPPPLSPPAPFPPKIIPSTPFPPKNTPPAPRLDRSRERYPRSSLEPSFVEISQHGPHRPDTNTNRSRSTSSRPIVPYDEQVRRLGLSPSTPGRDAAVFEQRHYSRRVDAPGAVPVERYERVVHRGREHVERRPSSSEERRQVRFSEDEVDSLDSEASRRYRQHRQLAHRPRPEQQELANRRPCGPDCVDHPYRQRQPSPHRHPQHHRRHHRRHHRTGSESRDASASDKEDEERKKQRKKLIYTGLAVMSTVVAGNNIYQATKAHQLRKKELSEGEMCTAEAKRLRQQAVLLDVFSLGVAGVVLNNVRMGWKRAGS